MVLIFFSCDNKGMDDDYSLIGTWEAAGDYTYSGGMGNYKDTLVFHNDTEYTTIFYYRPVGTTEWKNSGEVKNTYTYDEENITYTHKVYESDVETSKAYKFTDRNTLVTRTVNLPSDITNPVYKRKK